MPIGTSKSDRSRDPNRRAIPPPLPATQTSHQPTPPSHHPWTADHPLPHKAATCRGEDKSQSGHPTRPPTAATPADLPPRPTTKSNNSTNRSASTAIKPQVDRQKESHREETKGTL
ncbi:hypothetical protein QQ045_017549 [Rhodiola kirilowii]